MPHGNEESLQQLIDRLPDLVGHFYNDAPAPHFSRAGTGKTAPFIPPAFTNWRDEQRSWAETAALLHQSHHMPELFLDGPDALRLLERLGINTVGNFTLDRAKQFVACTTGGHVIGDCIAYRLGEESFELVSGMPLQNWVHYNAERGGYDVKVRRAQSAASVRKKRPFLVPAEPRPQRVLGLRPVRKTGFHEVAGFLPCYSATRCRE